MYTSHPVFLDPKFDSIRLYRYMDFPKFESLLQRKELYFCPVDKLDDQFEGSFPQKEIDYHKRHNNWDGFDETFKSWRNRVFISCWHYNEHESAGMWKLYSHTGKGIAIQTTISRFKKSFHGCQKEINIGRVIYIDYAKETFYQGEANGFRMFHFGTPFIHKRNIFQDEREYRALHICHDPQLIDQPYFQVDLDVLIENVIVAPQSGNQFVEQTEILLQDLLPNKKVIRSMHDQQPFS
jgi:hypothetical protein